MIYSPNHFHCLCLWFCFEWVMARHGTAQRGGGAVLSRAASSWPIITNWVWGFQRACVLLSSGSTPYRAVFQPCLACPTEDCQQIGSISMCALLGKFFHNLSAAAFDVAALIEANFPAIATTLRFGSGKNGFTSIWLQGQLISSSFF